MAIDTASYSAVYVVTPKTGKYRIKGLRPGLYHVGFTATTCPNKGNWLMQWYRHVNSIALTRAVVKVPVSAGKDTPGINAALVPGAEITGSVRNRSGRPLSGICVYASYDFGPIISEGVTGQNGRYTAPGLFPGVYNVEFRVGCGTKDNYAFQWWRGANLQDGAKLIRLIGRRVVTGINAVLRPGATLTGTVDGLGSHGKRLPGVCVQAADVDQNGEAEGVTGRNGRYVLKGLATDHYDLYFDPNCFGPTVSKYLPAQRSVNVAAGHLATVNALLPPGAGISGLVTDSHGRPISGVCVNVLDNNQDMTRTGRNGTYSMTGLVPGHYPVQFLGGCGTQASLAPQFYRDKPDYSGANLVRFTGGQVTSHVDAVMQPGGTIAGVVRDRSDRPLPAMCVGIIAPSQSDVVGSGFDRIAFTGPGGHYELRNLTPGPYQVSVGCYGGRYAAQWFNDQPDSTSASFVSVDPGVITSISANLGRSGAISGTVTNRAKRPLNGICVAIADPKTRLLLNSSTYPAYTYDERYRIGSLAPGRYVLQFSDCGRQNVGPQWYRNRTTAGFATAVLVRPGRTTTGIDPVMTSGGTISGVVTGPAGHRLADVCVQVFDPAALAFEGTITDSHGRYTLTELGSGRYSVYFSPCYFNHRELGAVSWPGRVRVVAPRATTGINVKLEPGGQVSGTVTGVKAQNTVCVLAVPTNPTGSRPSTLADTQGRYQLTDLAPGKYWIYFDDTFCDPLAFDESAPQWYNGQSTQATADTITVSAGHDHTGVSAILRPFGAISGVVETRAHRGVSGECVTAVPVRARPDPLYGEFRPLETAITGPSGHYSLIGVTPGQYKVEFTDGCGDAGFATQWWKDAGSARSATVITVGNTAVRGIDATLRR